MSAWKPLQMPHIRPSRWSSSAVTSSVIRGIAEEGGDELAGAVRLVAAGEAAGDKDHLRVTQRLCEVLHASGDAVRGQVVERR